LLSDDQILRAARSLKINLLVSPERNGYVDRFIRAKIESDSIDIEETKECWKSRL